MADEHRIEVRAVNGRVGPVQLQVGRHNVIVVKRPRFDRIVCASLRCSPGSAMLVPCPAGGERHPLGAILAAMGLLAAKPDRQLVVVGHGNPADGRDPQSLSEDRAQGVVALLNDDRDTWVEISARSGSPADVQSYINYLGVNRRWPCYAGEPKKEPDAEASNGIAQFQTAYNERFQGSLLVDGICGKQTLGALFIVLRDELRRWMTKHGLSDADIRLHPSVPFLAAGDQASSSPMFLGNDDPARQISVELIVFGPDEFPTGTPELATLYSDPLTVFEHHVPPEEPGAWEYGEVVVFLPEDDPARPDHRFQLRSNRGDYDRVLSAAEDGRIVEGFVELVFDDVPTDAELTMLVHAGAETTILYSDVPYVDLEKPRPVSDEELLNPHFLYPELSGGTPPAAEH